MSKRVNLREFQQNLSSRMHDKSRMGGRLSMLGVEIAGQNFLVEMTDISEVLSLPPMTPVPLTKPWLCGVANVRGSLYCVADMAAYMQQGTASGAAGNRLLLVAERYAFNAALLVERVFGLRDTGRWRQDGQQNYTDEKNVVWRKLDLVGLLGQPEFLQIGV